MKDKLLKIAGDTMLDGLRLGVANVMGSYIKKGVEKLSTIKLNRSSKEEEDEENNSNALALKEFLD